uniref:Tripartite motif containing 35-28 n=1 Tax=Tetraodon nigroviridis TaxID=99883 RepID=H3C6F8_TETNG
MEQDVSEELFHQEMTCSVCRDIFKDPWVLPCSHSFCQECLQGSVNPRGRRCPLCRESFVEGRAVPNRVLSDICRAYKTYPLPGIQKPDGEAVCKLHMKPLELYCEKDEQPVCVECVTMHNTHTLWPLKDAVPLCKLSGALEQKIQIFERKVTSYQTLTQNLDNTVDYIKNQASEAEKQIQVEFKKLRDALLTEERLRLSELAQEEEQKIAAVQKLTKNVNQDISDLKKLIVSVKKEIGNEDLRLLQDLKIWRRDRLRRHGKFDIQFCACDTVRSVITRVFKMSLFADPVVFDPNTASPWLSLDADLTAVKESHEPLITPDNPERFDPCGFVLGAEGYTSGKHRWDVMVRDCPSWVVGVCKEAVARKKKFTLSPSRGVWCIGLSKGVCTAFTNERMALQVQQRLERIRIKLDMDKGEVSFWDGESATHLVTLQHNFNVKIFPFFGPGVHSTSMILVPG